MRPGGVDRPDRPKAAKADFGSLLESGGPPPELKPEMAKAAQRVDELRDEGRQLRFERDEQTGRIRVELRDLEGKLIRVISPAEALEVARGAPL